MTCTPVGAPCLALNEGASLLHSAPAFSDSAMVYVPGPKFKGRLHSAALALIKRAKDVRGVGEDEAAASENRHKAAAGAGASK